MNEQEVQKILFDFYNELADENKWQTKNYDLILKQSKIIIRDRTSKVDLLELKAFNK